MGNGCGSIGRSVISNTRTSLLWTVQKVKMSTKRDQEWPIFKNNNKEKDWLRKSYSESPHSILPPLFNLVTVTWAHLTSQNVSTVATLFQFCHFDVVVPIIPCQMNVYNRSGLPYNFINSKHWLTQLNSFTHSSVVQYLLLGIGHQCFYLDAYFPSHQHETE